MPCAVIINGWSHLLSHIQEGAQVVLGTRVLGMAQIVSPMRVKYSTETSGPYLIPSDADVRGATRQLHCHAKGEGPGFLDAHLLWTFLTPRLVAAREAVASEWNRSM